MVARKDTWAEMPFRFCPCIFHLLNIVELLIELVLLCSFPGIVQNLPRIKKSDICLYFLQNSHVVDFNLCTLPWSVNYN